MNDIGVILIGRDFEQSLAHMARASVAASRVNMALAFVLPEQFIEQPKPNLKLLVKAFEAPLLPKNVEPLLKQTRRQRTRPNEPFYAKFRGKRRW